jgi:hypothetical protein
MLSDWWYVWIVVLFLLLLPPIGYGWGYRRWGPPLPRYFQRRRAQRATAGNAPSTFNHHAWGWGGDLVWFVLVLGAFWATWAALSRSR